MCEFSLGTFVSENRLFRSSNICPGLTIFLAVSLRLQILLNADKWLFLSLYGNSLSHRTAWTEEHLNETSSALHLTKQRLYRIKRFGGGLDILIEKWQWCGKGFVVVGWGMGFDLPERFLWRVGLVIVWCSAVWKASIKKGSLHLFHNWHFTYMLVIVRVWWCR